MDSEGEIDYGKLIKPAVVGLKRNQVDIIIALSDRKGYGASKLAEMTGGQYEHTLSLLDELSSDRFGNLEDSISIRYFHLKDPLRLVHKIQDQRDPVSKYIFKNIPETVFKNVPESSIFNISLLLSVGLNNMLFDSNFFNRERFSNVELSSDAKNLISMGLKKGGIRILNRILMEDTYPDEICKTRIPLTYKPPRSQAGESRNPYDLCSNLRVFKFIVEHLKSQIILDRCKLEEMNARLEIGLKALGGFKELIREDRSIRKEIRTSNHDMEVYQDRYDKNIAALRKFMTSNYVKNLEKEFGFIERELKELNDNEFDLMEFYGISYPKELVSELDILEMQNEIYAKGLDLNDNTQ